ncbi:MAG: hypothetical protein LBP19_10825 [Treponema sp.]|jgi:hypothetical protein|nr:hypothetical protein [Treponema sp.]
MKNARDTIRKMVRKLCTGLGLTTAALVIQACYGTPQSMGLDVLIRGTVRSKETNKPVEGIRVSVVEDSYCYDLTDRLGRFQIYVPQEESFTVRFDDIDGKENGLYSPAERPVNIVETTIDMGDIPLDVAVSQ